MHCLFDRLDLSSLIVCVRMDIHTICDRGVAVCWRLFAHQPVGGLFEVTGRSKTHHDHVTNYTVYVYNRKWMIYYATE